MKPIKIRGRLYSGSCNGEGCLERPVVTFEIMGTCDAEGAARLFKALERNEWVGVLISGSRKP